MKTGTLLLIAAGVYLFSSLKKNAGLGFFEDKAWAEQDALAENILQDPGFAAKWGKPVSIEFAKLANGVDPKFWSSPRVKKLKEDFNAYLILQVKKAAHDLKYQKSHGLTQQDVRDSIFKAVGAVRDNMREFSSWARSTQIEYPGDTAHAGWKYDSGSGCWRSDDHPFRCERNPSWA